jgi:excisionase family DNA binding protein
MDKLLLTPEEAAERLSVGRSRIFELISSGRLRSVRIGASRRIPAAALTDFVNELIGGDDGPVDDRLGSKSLTNVKS